MPDGAVGEEIGEGAGEDDGLLFGAVIGRPEIDGVLVDAVEEEARHLGEPRLGVTHGGRVIAVDIAEVALPFDQRVAGGELLGEPHQRVVDRLVAVRMELADDVADDARRFLEGGAGLEPELAHGVEEAAVDRLQPVAHVRQRPLRDRREGIGKVALLERLAKVDRLDRA